jgi:hypothetical protein
MFGEFVIPIVLFLKRRSGRLARHVRCTECHYSESLGMLHNGFYRKFWLRTEDANAV